MKLSKWVYFESNHILKIAFNFFKTKTKKVFVIFKIFKTKTLVLTFFYIIFNCQAEMDEDIQHMYDNRYYFAEISSFLFCLNKVTYCIVIMVCQFFFHITD